MSAFSLNPSYDWQGNDGNWSTFTLRIGTGEQTVHLLPSTSGSGIWVVDQDGCDPTFTDCPDLRGSTFDQNASSTWTRSGSGQNPVFNVSFVAEETLGYSVLGSVGSDEVKLGNENPSRPLDRQSIQTYLAYAPFFLGMFGLDAQNTTVGTSHYRSVLGSLNSSSSIPSAYWAYTAGAHWTGTWASLTFGGYDKTRGVMSDALTAPFTHGSQNFLVSVQDIKLRTSSRAITAAGTPVTSFLDSVVPEIWLAQGTCEAFEDIYGLQWNDEYEMYFMDDTQHTTNMANNPTATFTLARNNTSTDSVVIELPYGAFDFTASFPLAGINGSGQQRYFPLKRASASQQYLGRTFLQSAYLAADYDRDQFHVMQALYPSSSTAAEVVDVNRPNSGSHGLSTGIIVGIAVGAAAVVALIGGAIFWLWRRRKQNSRFVGGSFRASSLGGTTMDGTNEGMPWEEWFKPEGQSSELPEDQVKPELDATTTVRGLERLQRAELAVGSVRRTSQQSGFSRTSAVSPVGGEGRPTGQLVNHSPTSFGQPSPPQLSDRGSGHYSPGQPSPPMSESQYWNINGPYELPAIQTADHVRPVLSETRSEPLLASELSANASNRRIPAPLFAGRFEDTAYNAQRKANVQDSSMDGR